jgi:hypothetical protein
MAERTGKSDQVRNQHATGATALLRCGHHQAVQAGRMAQAPLLLRAQRDRADQPVAIEGAEPEVSRLGQAFGMPTDVLFERVLVRRAVTKLEVAQAAQAQFTIRRGIRCAELAYNDAFAPGHHLRSASGTNCRSSGPT